MTTVEVLFRLTNLHADFVTGDINGEVPSQLGLLRQVNHAHLLRAEFEFSVAQPGSRDPTCRLAAIWTPSAAELAGRIWSTGNDETQRYHSLLTRHAWFAPFLCELLDVPREWLVGHPVYCRLTLEGL